MTRKRFSAEQIIYHTIHKKGVNLFELTPFNTKWGWGRSNSRPLEYHSSVLTV